MLTWQACVGMQEAARVRTEDREGAPHAPAQPCSCEHSGSVSGPAVGLSHEPVTRLHWSGCVRVNPDLDSSIFLNQGCGAGGGAD